MKTLTISLLTGSLALLIAAGCSPAERTEAQKAADTNPETLRFGILVPEESPQTLAKLAVLEQYFTRTLGRPVKQISISNSSAMIEAMRSRKIDLGTGGAFTYLVASAKAGAEAIAMTGVADGQPQLYTACLLTSPATGLKSIDDVVKKSKNLTLSWAYPTSTSGHLIPRYALQQRGVLPENFKEVFTSTNHAATILSVASGKVDVAAVMTAVVERFVASGKIKAADVRVIWTSDPIIEGPIYVRKELDPALKKRIQQAYVNMVRDDPAARQALSTQYTANMRYIAIADSAFQPLRDIVNQIDGLKFEETR
jgi:phosphonate transport system substrate-binding protein